MTETGAALSKTQRRVLEQRYFAAAELQNRRENDPLLNFKTNPGGQTDFVRAMLGGKLREGWFIAANRSGKSDAGACVGSHKARFGNPEARFIGASGSAVSVKDTSTSGWVVSLDFPTSRDVVQPKYFNNGFLPPGATHEPFIPPHEYEEKDWRVSDQILRLKNGSIIGFKSADSGRLKFQGAEKDWIHFDEESPKSIYDECVIRVGSRPLTIFGTCTLLPPEGQVGGITWIFNEKVRPWQQGLAVGMEIFNASIYDNPHIPVSEIEALENIYAEGSAQRRIRLNGELIPGLSGSRVYASFQSGLNVRDVGPIQMRRPLAWIWDFNVEPMVTLLGQRQGRLFRLFRELILEEGNIAEMCDTFRSVHPKHLAEVWIFGDATGKERSHQTRRSSYQLIMNNMLGYNVPIKLKVPEANPSVVDRINAVNGNCLGPDGEVLLEISSRCEETIQDMEQVLTDGRGGIKKTFNRKDLYYRRTHTSDALGYWIAFEAPITPRTLAQGAGQSVKVPTPSYGRKT